MLFQLYMFCDIKSNVYGTKESWPILRHYPNVGVGGLWKTYEESDPLLSK